MAIELKEKYAHQLQRSNGLSINTLEGWNDFARVAYSKNLIDQGIEPTEENLQKYQEEIEVQVEEDQEIEQNFYQFIAECCEKVEESPRYKKRQEEVKVAVEQIKSKLTDEDKKLVDGFDGLTDYFAAVETTIEDDYYRAGFIAGVRLGQ